jgi:site-specific DNA-methyltransferase (adenine-specific)
MDIMAQYPDKYFDLAVVDPPYGIGAHIGTNQQTKKKFLNRKKYRWDDSTPNDKYFEELFRISKKQIIWGGDYFTEHLPLSAAWIVWDKGLRFLDFGDCEFAWVSPKFAKYRCGQKRIFTFNPTAPSKRMDKIHPTQKPIALYDWIFKNYANPNDKILDTHLGSGSSRIAAHRAGLDFVGVELDKEYFDAQEKRFAEYVSQLKLF